MLGSIRAQPRNIRRRENDVSNKDGRLVAARNPSKSLGNCAIQGEKRSKGKSQAKQSTEAMPLQTSFTGE